MKPNPVELAIQQAVQQQELINKLANDRYQLSNGLALSVLEALEVWVQMAGKPAQTGHLAARDQLRRLSRVLDQARAIQAGITLPDQVSGSGNGRA